MWIRIEYWGGGVGYYNLMGISITKDGLDILTWDGETEHIFFGNSLKEISLIKDEQLLLEKMETDILRAWRGR